MPPEMKFSSTWALGQMLHQLYATLYKFQNTAYKSVVRVKDALARRPAFLAHHLRACSDGGGGGGGGGGGTIMGDDYIPTHCQQHQHQHQHQQGRSDCDEIRVRFTESGRLGLTFWTTTDGAEMEWRPVIEDILPDGLAAALLPGAEGAVQEEPRCLLRPGLALVRVQGVSVLDLDGEAAVGKVAAAGRPLELVFRPLPPERASHWHAEVLRRAASDGDLTKATKLLQQLQRPRDPSGSTDGDACGDGALVRAVLDARGPQGVTALMLAAAKGFGALVVVLLAAGAKAHVETDSGATALLLAAREGHTQCVTELAKAAPATIDQTTGAGSTALIEAAAFEHSETCAALLKAGASTGMTNAEGSTALMVSAQFGHHEIVQQLLVGGASASEAGAKSLTPLVLAAQNGHVVVCEQLLRAGADMFAQAARGDTALHMAAQQGHREVVELLVCRGGAATPHILRCNGQTALHVAAAWGQLPCAEVLIAAGFDLSAVDEDGDDCVKLARDAGQHEVSAALAQKGRLMRVTQQHREAANTLKETANAQFKSGDYRSAAAMYRMASQTDPSSALLPANLAAALLKLDDYAGAAEAAEQCVALDASSQKGHYRLGCARQGLGKYDSAIEAFARTLSLNPSFREAKRAANVAARASVRQHKARGTNPPQSTVVFAKALKQQQHRDRDGGPEQ
eukprot:COSAG02_NODE_180_length_31057_cov_21.869501_6_plen_683_part_00